MRNTREQKQNNNDSGAGSMEEQILNIRRVSTKRAGGSSFHFSALSVVGDRAGNVGVAVAKSKENIAAIRKAKEKAKRSMIVVPVTEEGSIPHEVYIKNGAAIIFLKPAPLGAGIIAGGSIRQVLELAGIRNISAKIIGTNNPISNAYTVIEALKRLHSEPVVAKGPVIEETKEETNE